MRACRGNAGSDSGSRTERGRPRGATGRYPARCTALLDVRLIAPYVRPWNAPSKAISAGRRVALRASLIAPSTASVPEFVRKTRFLLGPGATRASRSHSAAIPS